jgi:hypothetical protein
MLLENRRLEESSIETDMETVEKDHLIRLESTLMELERVTRDVAKAKVELEFAKAEAMQEKRKAEEIGQKLAATLGSETGQV